jgi:hypothetical protein
MCSVFCLFGPLLNSPGARLGSILPCERKPNINPRLLPCFQTCTLRTPQINSNMRKNCWLPWARTPDQEIKESCSIHSSAPIDARKLLQWCQSIRGCLCKSVSKNAPRLHHNKKGSGGTTCVAIRATSISLDRSKPSVPPNPSSVPFATKKSPNATSETVAQPQDPQPELCREIECLPFSKADARDLDYKADVTNRIY